MLTQEQVLEAVRGGREPEAFDGRDYGRLVQFFAAEHLETFGYKLNDGKPWEPKPWTEEAVIAQLREDVEFGFEKALNRRGLSANCMAAVVRMWMWILEQADILEVNYPQYGLPILKAVAVRYGLPNPIGNDAGTEHKYSERAARDDL